MNTKSDIILTFLLLLLLNSCQEEHFDKVVANFSASKTTIVVGDNIQFIDSSDGNPSSWQWTFEGGSPNQSSIRNPTITYPSKGRYKVTLVSSNKKNMNHLTREAFVTVLPPVKAAFSASSISINQGTKISFIDKSEGEPLNWSWTFPGGTPSSSIEQNPEISFTSSGKKLVTLVVSNGASSSSTSSLIEVIPTDGLVLYFPFKGNSEDLSGKNNNGIILGATLTNDRSDNPNEAYAFDGDNDQIVFPNITEFDNIPMSISFWVNFDELKSSILGIDNFDNYQSGVWFSVGQSTNTFGKLAVSFGNGETPPGPNNRKTFLTDNTISTGEWYHVVGIVTNSDFKIYLNGTSINGSYSGAAVIYKNTQHSGSIGRVWDPNAFFKGKIDDFRIYNRILSSDEVELLFNEP